MPQRASSIPPTARCRESAGVIFTGPPQDPEAHLRNVTVFGSGTVDRSPCGTGTSAVMAVLDAMGLLPEQRDLRAREPHRHAVSRPHRAAHPGRRVRRRSCRRSRAPPGSPASTPSSLTMTIRSRMGSAHPNRSGQGARVVTACDRPLGPLTRECCRDRAVEQDVQRLAVEHERRRLMRPGQLEAARHRRHPDLADGVLGLTTNLAGAGSSNTICRTPFCSSSSKPSASASGISACWALFERLVGLQAELLLGHASSFRRMTPGARRGLTARSSADRAMRCKTGARARTSRPASCAPRACAPGHRARAARSRACTGCGAPAPRA